MTPVLRDDRGSAGISVVLLTPVVLALLAFAVLAGRVGTARQDVVSAAQAAARAASLRQPGPAAEADALTPPATLRSGRHRMRVDLGDVAIERSAPQWRDHRHRHL